MYTLNDRVNAEIYNCVVSKDTVKLLFATSNYESAKELISLWEERLQFKGLEPAYIDLYFDNYDSLDVVMVALLNLVGYKNAKGYFHIDDFDNVEVKDILNDPMHNFMAIDLDIWAGGEGFCRYNWPDIQIKKLMAKAIAGYKIY